MHTKDNPEFSFKSLVKSEHNYLLTCGNSLVFYTQSGLLKIAILLKGGDILNQRDMFKEQLTEDLNLSEEKFKRWEEAYKFYLNLESSSKGLLSYYKKEVDVAYAVWQYKLRNYNKKFGPINE